MLRYRLRSTLIGAFRVSGGRQVAPPYMLPRVVVPWTLGIVAPREENATVSNWCWPDLSIGRLWGSITHRDTHNIRAHPGLSTHPWISAIPTTKTSRARQRGQTEGHIMAETKTPLEERFSTAAGGNPPTDEQRNAVRQITENVINLASHIEAHVPAGRNKSLALTALEDVHMRANRGIFATGYGA